MAVARTTTRVTPVTGEAARRRIRFVPAWTRPRKPEIGPIEKRRGRYGWLFISPWLVGFTLFYLTPMAASAFFSLLDFQLSTPDEATFVGLDNWRRALFNDPNVWRSWVVTLRFAVINLPLGLIVAFGFALLLNSEWLRARNLFRTLFYAPSVVPFIAATLIFSQVLNNQTGWVNRMISVLGVDATGIDGIRWFDDPTLIPVTYTFIGIWGVGNAILINLAGLQGVPTSLYESASIDGAGWWMRMRHITIPMISPVIFYNLVLGLVGLLQYFLQPFVLNGTTGYPEGATNFYMIYFYKQAFQFAQMGYGATLAWILFFVALVLTVVTFGTARHWVYYSAEQP
jgi:ABC-type sugar transport system permease subunit